MSTNPLITQSSVNSGFTDLKPSDLEDPGLFQLNRTFRQLYTWFGTFLTPGNQYTYPSTPTFVTSKASGQPQPPTDPTEFLTRASGDALYGPKAIQTALTTGAYQNTTGAQVNPVQPIVTGGGSGAGGSGVTYYIGTLVGTHYKPDITNGEFQQILLTSSITIDALIGASTSALISFILIQDATGGRNVTWDTSYIGTSISDVDQTAGTYSVYEFVLRSSDLRPVLRTRPITGLPWP